MSNKRITPIWIDDTTDEWKPMNAKGKRHHITCFHDEPDITVCTCGGCTCAEPPPHLAPCPRGPGGKYEIPFRKTMEDANLPPL